MAVRMYYGISGQPYSIFFIYPVFSCFYAERIFVRSAVLSCAGQEALGRRRWGRRCWGMLPFYPFADLPYKGRRANYPDHRAKGQNIYEKFCLICQIIVDGTDPAFHFRVIFRMLFIVGKMQHAPFQGVAFPADFKNHWFRGLLDGFKTAGFKVWWA